MKNKKVALAIILIALALCAISLGVFYFFFNKQESINIIQPEINKTPSNILDEINNYQERYFTIIKRHDALLKLENDEESMKDLKELKELFQEVKSKIDKNCEYLKEYEKIKEKYKNNNGENTYEMNEFAMRKYKAFDKLLNDTYKEVKSQLSEEDFEQLKKSQIAWLKDVEAYDATFESQGFGTIRTLIKLDYEINMRGFRTLLLMLYLKNDQVKLSDFLGDWDEVIAGRIYLNIKKKKDGIEVKYGGANSAYSHSESIYTCKYDEQTESLICKGAQNYDYTVSCNDIVYDDDIDGFSKCEEENPNNVKEIERKSIDDKTRIIKIKKGSRNHHIIYDEKYLDKEIKDQLSKDYQNMGLYFENDKESLYYKSK